MRSGLVPPRCWVDVRGRNHARVLHDGQMRKGTRTPYFSHLLAVASIVLQNGGTEDEAIAALLHHAAEDQGGAPTLVDIRTRFGTRIAEIVEACERAFDERIHPAVYSTFSEIGFAPEGEPDKQELRVVDIALGSAESRPISSSPSRQPVP